MKKFSFLSVVIHTEIPNPKPLRMVLKSMANDTLDASGSYKAALDVGSKVSGREDLDEGLFGVTFAAGSQLECSDRRVGDEVEFGADGQ
jgi:hypothetical protein